MTTEKISCSACGSSNNLESKYCSICGLQILTHSSYKGTGSSPVYKGTGSSPVYKGTGSSPVYKGTGSSPVCRECGERHLGLAFYSFFWGALFIFLAILTFILFNNLFPLIILGLLGLIQIYNGYQILKGKRHQSIQWNWSG
ncbi:MAG: hypothetical protein HeimC3_16870 [Candidatus Heimdallarchaeota archaeon LC_3]|nr:MAG: hypothetical protein HeimC3_16870 [Candidatus Heimdallarchaeota archaeon LC_3]